MAKEPLVSQEMADKFKTEKDTPYLRWVREEGLDIISAQYVPDLRTVDLKPWASRGGRGVMINHEASRTSNDCYVCEIAPGKKLEPRRQPVRGDDPGPLRPRLDHGVEQCRASGHVRMEGGRDLRHSAQLPATSTSTARGRSRCGSWR